MIYDLDSDVVLGRGDRAEIRLEDPFASSRHARVYRQGNILVVEDLRSTNGTYLNEELLETPRPLHPGDRVRIGDSEFTFEVDWPMLRVAEQYATTDTGRQRRANEDSLLARSPLFVVADGMGGAQAGEVASKIAVDLFEQGLGDTVQPEGDLAARASAANARIHELSHTNAEQAGMGTTLTAVYVAPEEVAIAHVGDSRAYRLRAGELMRLTDDHSLVDELMRQGKITPEEAIDHPQRSVITRALGPEPAVEIDTRSYAARAGDVYLLCSDGLTTMLPEERLSEILRSHQRLRDAGEALIAAANDAGGRDNITVVLFRLEDPAAPAAGADPATEEQSAIVARSPRRPRSPHGFGGSRELPGERPPVQLGDASAVALASEPQPRISPSPCEHAARACRPRPQPRQASAGACEARAAPGRIGRAGRDRLGRLSGARIGVLRRHQLPWPGHALRGVPYQLPGGIDLYNSEYVSGVSASTLSARATADAARPLAALGRRRGRAAAQPRTGAARVNRPIVRLYGLVVVLFALLVAFTSRWTVFEACSLRENPLNQRALLSRSGSSAARSSPPTGPCWRTACAAAKAPFNAPTRPASCSPRRSATTTPTSAQRAWSASATGAGWPIERCKPAGDPRPAPGQATAGREVITTLDPRAQRTAVAALGEHEGAVVALDPRTGAVG